MLQTQVAYWTLQESKRHNLATENLSSRDLERKDRELNQTIKYQAEQVAYWQREVDELVRHNKASEKAQLKQAQASLKQAKAALQNAKTNKKALKYQAKQAKAALIQAKSSKIQAKAATSQAKSSAKQASAALKNAETNAFNASTNLYNAKTARYTGLKDSETKRRQQESTSDLQSAQKRNALYQSEETRARTESVGKSNKYYEVEHLLFPGINSTSGLIRSVPQ